MLNESANGTPNSEVVTPLYLPSLREGHSDWQQMLTNLGELYVRGVKIDWIGFDKDYTRRKVVLPTYPFQRQRYWVESSSAKTKDSEPNLYAPNLYEMAWKQNPLALKPTNRYP